MRGFFVGKFWDLGLLDVFLLVLPFGFNAFKMFIAVLFCWSNAGEHRSPTFSTSGTPFPLAKTNHWGTPFPSRSELGFEFLIIILFIFYCHIPLKRFPTKDVLYCVKILVPLDCCSFLHDTQDWWWKGDWWKSGKAKIVAITLV